MGRPKELKELICKYEDCNNLVYSRGYCRKHYDYLRNKYLLEKLILNKDRKCCICGDNFKIKKYENNFYCNKHFLHMKRHGKILNRTKYDPNEIIIYENYAEVCLYNSYSNENGRVKIDLDDVELIKKYKWFLNDCSGYDYAATGIDDKIIGMHRLITNCPDDKVVDHINYDTLDNRKENLRICSHADNIRHARLSDKNKYGVKGIYERNDIHKKWASTITVDRKAYYLGYYYTLEEAAKVRLEAEKKYFGEYLPENRIENIGVENE